MKPDLRGSNDFLAGLLFLAIGVGAMLVARGYPFGTAARMGSGYFPTVLGVILVLFGVYLCAGVGGLGCVLAKLECEPAPLLLGYVLGPLLEEHLRRAMLLARGDPSLFVTRPISMMFMIGTALVLAAVIAPALRKSGSG